MSDPVELSYCSAFLSDDQAEAEFRRQNPKAGPSRVVRFTTGRRARAWVGNVVAVGNAYGFVEPLEATALGAMALQSWLLADALVDCDRQPPPGQLARYNETVSRYWDGIRDFIAVHYRFNTRLHTPFWVHCHQHTDLAGAAPVVQAYQELGPSGLWAETLFAPFNAVKLGGFATLLRGQQVPYRKTFLPTPAERETWATHQAQYRQSAAKAITISEALAAVRSSGFKWPD